jgi:hypothetical protein
VLAECGAVCLYDMVMNVFFEEGDVGKACSHKTNGIFNLLTYNSIMVVLCKARVMDKTIV